MHLKLDRSTKPGIKPIFPNSISPNQAKLTKLEMTPNICKTGDDT